MSTTNFSDPNVLTAMILSDGVIKGIATANDAIKHIIYEDENPATSLIATLAKLAMIKAQLITYVAKEMSQELASILDIDDKVETAVYLNSIIAGSLTIPEAELLINDASKVKALTPVFIAAQKHNKQDSTTVADAVSTIDSYLSKKRAESELSP